MSSIPVPFNDIGKSAKDLLTKDFPTDAVKLEVKTTAPNGVTFRVTGNKDSKTGIIHGDLETKYSDKKNGLTFTETWTTSNHLNGKIELDNNFAKGLKLELHTSLLPSVGQKNAKLGITYKQPNVNTHASLDIFKVLIFVSSTDPFIVDFVYDLQTHFSVDSVVGRDGFLAGGEVIYDVLDGKITRYHGALGFTAPEYAVALHATNSFSVFSGELNQQLCSQRAIRFRV
ncbi:eukaryotic porin/Tom40, partial [Jimgerdemannia flammicorona]